MPVGEPARMNAGTRPEGLAGLDPLHSSGSSPLVQEAARLPMITARVVPNLSHQSSEGAIDYETPHSMHGIPGSPGALRDAGPGRGPGPAGPGAGSGTPRGVQATASREREPDVRAITDLLASFVKAYNEKDAKALGALFTPDAEIEDEDGEVTRGRDAIVERFSGIFKEDGGDRLAVETDSLRFLGTDLAIEEGTASLTTRAGRTSPTPTATA